MTEWLVESQSVEGYGNLYDLVANGPFMVSLVWLAGCLVLGRMVLRAIGGVG